MFVFDSNDQERVHTHSKGPAAFPFYSNRSPGLSAEPQGAEH